MKRTEEREITRRDFLRAAAGMTLATALGTGIAGEDQALGFSDLSRIHLIKLGWMEDALI